jgi:Family of unknown function (DUF5678)
MDWWTEPDDPCYRFGPFPNPAMRAINRNAIAKAYRGKWIALKSDRRTIVASGSSVQAVLEAAKRKGTRDPIVTRMPQSPARFIGPSFR